MPHLGLWKKAVSVRARNVTSDGFEVALFEEEQRMGGDGHGVETVGYLAVYSPAGGGLIDVDGEQVPYLLQTLKADERWSPVLSQRLKVEEEQSRDSETGHVDETLHVLALGQALFAQQVSHSGGDTTALRRLEPTEEAPMEWGVLRDITHQWQVLPFAKTYDDPVVVVKPVSSDGGDPSVIRLRNITTTDAEVRVQEWNYLDGSHTTENVFYLVSEATTSQSGPYSLGGLSVQAGWLDTNALALAGGWASVDFTESFGDVPAVFASVMTYAGGDAVTTRIDGLDATGFSIAMDEQENKDPYHVTETLGWIAIDQGSGTTNGRKLKVFTTALDDTLTAVGYDDALVPFTTGHRHPTVVGDVNSTYEADPVFLRYASPTNTQIQLKLTEETSADAETSHVPEDVGIFVGE